MRWLPVLLVLCLLGGIVGLRWLGGDEPTAPPGSVPAATEPWHGDAAPMQQAPWDDPARPAEATSGDTEAAEPAEADRSEVDATTTGERRALVVRGTPPVPVADAEVLFLDDLSAQKRLLVLGAEPPPARNEWPERWGQRVRTDADGVAILPGPLGNLLVAARSGDEFAFATLRSGRRAVTLHLVADEQVALQVQRTGGQPAVAAPLALLQWLGKGEAKVVWRGETGPDGTVLVHHFQLYRQNGDQPVADERFAALVPVPTPVPVLVEFAGRPATRDPVVLRLPPVGDVEVQVTDHLGTPLLSPAWIAARLDGKQDAAAPFPYSQGLLVRSTSKPAGDGVVRLPFVGGGTTLRVSAHFEADRRGTSITSPGPDQDGTVLRVTLPLGERQVLLAGRLLLASGAPLGPGPVSFAVWGSERDQVAGNLSTIADGRFDLVLTGRDEPPPFVLHVRVRQRGAEGEPLELGARVHVPELTGGRRVELGDIVLGELPPLVSGLVVDDRGEPIAAAAVQVQCKQPDRQRGDPWRPLPQLQTRTEDDGTFCVHGELPRGELRVRADTDQHFANSEALQTQGQQVRLRLDRNGIVRGRALLPDWIADGTATLSLQPVDEALRKEQTRSVPLRRRGGGRFTVEPLRPGRFDALVTLRNVAQPVLVIADCFVQPGESHDPRLQELDLRQALFRYRLRAVDAAGQPFALEGPIQAQLSMPDGSTVEAGFRWQHGQAELITPGALADLLFFGRGFLPQRLTLGPGEHDVYLQALRPALLELPGARALCGPERRVRVSGILTEATGLPESLGGIDQRTGERFSFPRWDLGRSSGAWLERYDTVEVPLMRSGTYEVVLRVHATASERSPQASVSLGTFALRVDAPSLLPVRVPVDAAAVQQACASVDERQRAVPAEAAPRPR
jgi:hypothetical protein